MPKKKFVWETNLRTDIIEARKERTWKEMETRKMFIEEAIKRLEKIYELSEKAQEFGVLEVEAWNSGVDVEFEDAVLVICPYSRVIQRVFGMSPEELRSLIKDDAEMVLDKLLEFEREQLNDQNYYMWIAERYLIEVPDEEEGKEEGDEEDSS